MCDCSKSRVLNIIPLWWLGLFAITRYHSYVWLNTTMQCWDSSKVVSLPFWENDNRQYWITLTQFHSHPVTLFQTHGKVEDISFRTKLLPKQLPGCYKEGAKCRRYCFCFFEFYWFLVAIFIVHSSSVGSTVENNNLKTGHKTLNYIFFQPL